MKKILTPILAVNLIFSANLAIADHTNKQKPNLNQTKEIKSPQIYSITITENQDSNGKKTIKYSGTEDLSKAQLKTLVNKFHNQQIEMAKQMNHMAREMNQEMHAMEKTFLNSSDPMLVVSPIVIEIKQVPKQKEKLDKSWWQQVKERLTK